MPGPGGPTITKELPPGAMTFIGLAKATEIPADTLRRWHKEKKLPHVGTVKKGHINVYLFNLDSIAIARKLRRVSEGGSEAGPS